MYIYIYYLCIYIYNILKICICVCIYKCTNIHLYTLYDSICNVCILCVYIMCIYIYSDVIVMIQVLPPLHSKDVGSHVADASSGPESGWGALGTA